MPRKKKVHKINVKNHSSVEVWKAVVHDLLQKYPKGPNGKLTRENYIHWATDPKHDNPDEGIKTICGYNVTDLFRLAYAHGIKTSSSLSMCHALYDLYPGLSDNAYTRRSRRLGTRLGNAISLVKNAGLPGIYEVSWGWDNINKVYVHALDAKDAEIQGSMFFKAVMPQDRNPYATFIREGSRLELSMYNKKATNRLEDAIASQEKKMQQLRDQIEIYNTKKDFIQTYGLTMMEAALDED